MNAYDSELVKSILCANDFEITKIPEEAEVVFLNTCAILGKVLRMRRGKSHSMEALYIGHGRH